MAKTYTFPSSTTYMSNAYLGWMRIKVTCTNNTDNGTTAVKIELQHIPNAHGSGTTMTPDGAISVTLGSTVKSVTLPSSVQGNTSTTWGTIFTETLTFNRNTKSESVSIKVSTADGSKALRLRSGSYYAYWDVSDTSKTYTYNASLEDIELNSTFASLPATMTTGVSYPVKVKRNSTSYYHKVRVYDKATGLAAAGASDAFKETITMEAKSSWMQRTTTSATLTMEMRLYTYSDSTCTTKIGSTYVQEFTLKADSSMVPTLTITTPVYVNDSAASEITEYVQNHSKLRTTFSADFGHTEGATLSAYAITVDGKTKTGTSATLTTDTITGSGTMEVTFTVTDTRGRKATITQSITVRPYSKPTVTIMSAFHSSNEEEHRGTETGQDTDTCLSFMAKAAISDLNGKNSIESFTAGIGAASYDITSNVLFTTSGIYDPDAAYMLTVTCTDSLGYSATATRKIPTRIWAMQFLDEAKGVAFGKAAEIENALQIPEGWKFMIGSNQLSASDVGARPSSWTPTASDVGARPNTWTPTAAQVGAVPTSRKVNGKALSADITLDAGDVGAVQLKSLGSATTATPLTITHTSTARYLIIASSATASREAIAIVYATNTTCAVKSVMTSSTTTFTASGNVLTVKSTSGTVPCYAMVFAGEL